MDKIVMKALRRCRNNLEADNVVLIDVDTYDFHNVIDLDLLESLTNKRRGPSGLKNDKNTPPRTYIYIDDDESPRERNHENGASSSNISPLKLSKGKRTYGLQSDDDDDDDDDEDENFDCELMEDFSGKLRAEWERAFLKRKGDLFSNNVNQNKQKHGQECSFNGTHNENKQNHGQDSSFNGTHNEKRGKSHVGSDNDYEDGIPCGESSFLNHDDGDMPGGKTFVCEDECGERDEMCEEIPCSSNQEKDGKDDVVNDDIIDDVSIEDSIIDQREKLKETEEYKRALEEELSARQIALKIQAEEAQQLRRIQKRKKAESLRLLDMERRQKQRVEEIRETQKKDEENMNLKEQYRTEVREELKKLEFMCRDMASLLRGLGIQVGDGPCPLSHEVRAAYKRALLSFHPDRASGSDMRQQVEAEEKFKLISRMKEKLSV